MKNTVDYVEIPINDFDRAINFYEKVFGCEFKRATVNGGRIAWLPFQEDTPSISGALLTGESYTPTTEGLLDYFNTDSIDDLLSKVDSYVGRISPKATKEPLVYFITDNIDVILSKVNSNEGRTLCPKTSIGELGWVAEFEDTEGNRIALHSQ